MAAARRVLVVVHGSPLLPPSGSTLATRPFPRRPLQYDSANSCVVMTTKATPPSCASAMTVPPDAPRALNVWKETRKKKEAPSSRTSNSVVRRQPVHHFEQNGDDCDARKSGGAARLRGDGRVVPYSRLFTGSLCRSSRYLGASTGSWEALQRWLLARAGRTFHDVARKVQSRPVQHAAVAPAAAWSQSRGDHYTPDRQRARRRPVSGSTRRRQHTHARTRCHAAPCDVQWSSRQSHAWQCFPSRESAFFSDTMATG